MTPEEAIKEFESELKWAQLNTYPYVSKQKIEADKLAIKALGQETKTGHWIWRVSSHECSCCHQYTCFSDKNPPRFCPNCGARMAESEEMKED